MNELKTGIVKPENITPQGGQLFVEYELPEEKTASGIILVKDTTDKNQKNYVGRVLAVGPDVKEIAVGTRIIFAKGRQYDFHLKPDAETAGFPSHCFITWYDVLAIVEGEGKVTAN